MEREGMDVWFSSEAVQNRIRHGWAQVPRCGRSICHLHGLNRIQDFLGAEQHHMTPKPWPKKRSILASRSMLLAELATRSYVERKTMIFPHGRLEIAILPR